MRQKVEMSTIETQFRALLNDCRTQLENHSQAQRFHFNPLKERIDGAKKRLSEFIHDPKRDYHEMLKIQIMLEREAAPQQGNMFLQNLAKEARNVMPVIGRSHKIFLNELRGLFDNLYAARDQFTVNLKQQDLIRFLIRRNWEDEALLVLRVNLWREVNAHNEIGFLKTLANQADAMAAMNYGAIGNFGK
jgi:hypothetical protein